MDFEKILAEAEAMARDERIKRAVLAEDFMLGEDIPATLEWIKQKARDRIPRLKKDELELVKKQFESEQISNQDYYESEAKRLEAEIFKMEETSRTGQRFLGEGTVLSEREESPKKGDSDREPKEPLNKFSKAHKQDINKEISSLMKEKDSPGFTMKASRWVISKIRDVYRMTPEELMGEESNIIKFIIKLILLLGILAANPLFGLFIWYIDRRINVGINLQQRTRLVGKLESELEIIEDKVSKETDSKEKETLIKIKNHIKNSISKLMSAKVLPEE